MAPGRAVGPGGLRVCLLGEIKRQVKPLGEGDVDVEAPFAQLRMRDTDLVGADRHGNRLERRLSYPLVLDPDLAPGLHVDLDDAARQMNGERGDLTRAHLQHVRRAVTESSVGQLELISPRRHPDSTIFGSPDQTSGGTDFQLYF